MNYKEIGYIENICIIPEYQGKGIGTEIIKAVINDIVEGLNNINVTNFIPENVSKIMNIIVGILIIFFGIKMLLKKEKN